MRYVYVPEGEGDQTAMDYVRSNSVQRIRASDKRTFELPAPASRRQMSHCSEDDPRIFQDTDDTVWQSAARRAARNGQPTKRRTPKDVDIGSLQSKPVDKMTKPEVRLVFLVLTYFVLNVLEASRPYEGHVRKDLQS